MSNLLLLEMFEFSGKTVCVSDLALPFAEKEAIGPSSVSSSPPPLVPCIVTPRPWLVFCEEILSEPPWDSHEFAKWNCMFHKQKQLSIDLKLTNFTLTHLKVRMLTEWRGRVDPPLWDCRLRNAKQSCKWSSVNSFHPDGNSGIFSCWHSVNSQNP